MNFEETTIHIILNEMFAESKGIKKQIEFSEMTEKYAKRIVKLFAANISNNKMACCDDEIHNTYRDYNYYAYCPECGKEL
jgi:hypothetical protein